MIEGIATCELHTLRVNYNSTLGMTHLNGELCDSARFVRYGTEYDRLELMLISALDEALAVLAVDMLWSA